MDEIRKQRTEQLGVHTHLLEWRETAPAELLPVLDKQIKIVERKLKQLARATKPVYNEKRIAVGGI